jgi:hypothetical protein
MNSGILYTFTAKPFRHDSGDWIFAAIPDALSEEIREYHQWQEEGWGRLKARAQVGESIWETSIWYDTKHRAYLLPLKEAIRVKEQVKLNEDIMIQLWI